MPEFNTIVAAAIFAAWFWKVGGNMIEAKEWPDLATALVLAGLAFAYTLVYIWDLEPFFPSVALGELILPVIEVIYGDWL